MFKLVVEQGEQAGEEFILREGENLIGRSRETDIRLVAEDTSISRVHARLSVQGREVLFENLGTHGTWVGDRKLENKGDKIGIVPGQSIRLGKEYILRLKEVTSPAADAGSEQTSVGPANETIIPPAQCPGLDTAAAARKVWPIAQPAAQDNATVPDSSIGPPSSGTSADFERAMRAKAEVAKLDEDQDESADGKTQAQKTRFAPEEEVVDKLRQERGKPRQRLFMTLGVVVIGIILCILLKPPPPAGQLEWDETYADATRQVPLGGYSLVYPKNETSREETIAGGLVITTRLGPKRDVPLVITLHEESDGKWAVQDSFKSVKEYMGRMQSKANIVFDQPSSRFEGEQNGVRIWNVSYKRNEKGMWAGMANLFCDGRRLEVLCVEIPVADQARAENFLYYSYYSDFPQEFEESHWEGRLPSANLSTATLLNQVRDDMRREAPSTWAMIESQLRMVLSKAVAEERPVVEKEALRLLVELRKKEARWYNSQQLQVDIVKRSGEKERVATLAQRCQAVFSDMDDRRYHEVRAWQQD